MCGSHLSKARTARFNLDQYSFSDQVDQLAGFVDEIWIYERWETVDVTLYPSPSKKAIYSTQSDMGWYNFNGSGK